MQVSSIDNNTYTTNFNGCVDKSIKKYIEGQVKNHIEDSLYYANKGGFNINKKDLTSIKENSKTMMSKLENFMNQLHPNTKLKVEDYYTALSPIIYLQNGKDKVFIYEATSSKKVSDSEIYLEHANPMYDETTLKKHHRDITTILNKMSSFINEFTSLNAKQIDEAMFTKKFKNAKSEIVCFYENAGFFNFGFNMKKAINSFFSFAKDIGKAENAKLMIQEAKEEAKIESKENLLKFQRKQKEKAKIVKDNNNFVKELLD